MKKNVENIDYGEGCKTNGSTVAIHLQNLMEIVYWMGEIH